MNTKSNSWARMRKTSWAAALLLALVGTSAPAAAESPAKAGSAKPAQVAKPGAKKPAPSKELEEAERLDKEIDKLFSEGKYGDRVPVAERAFAIREKYFGPEAFRLVDSVQTMGNAHFRAGEYAQV